MPSSSNQGKIPFRQEIYRALSSFSLKQKVFLFAFITIFISSCVGILWNINNHFLVDAAMSGGNLTEGIVGYPSRINPLLAITDADRDLSTLIYSGLMRINNAGEVIPDLAESYQISDNGLTYSFVLKEDLIWHDGKKLTTDDIEFTIQKAQDPNLKSPKRISWEGVKINKKSSREIEFILKKPYANFLEITTLGILPKHIWKDTKTEVFHLSENNLKGIGSGPYQIISFIKDSTGLPHSASLRSFKHYALGEPKITTLSFKFFDNEQQLIKAYERGEVESFSSIPPELALTLKKNGGKIREVSLPRTFAVFFNQNQTIFSDKNVRHALALATDKQKIVDDVLRGFGKKLDNPIPPGSIGYHSETQASQPNLTSAISLLEKSGWKKDSDGIFYKLDSKKNEIRLEFSLATSNTPELKETAQALALQWSKVGANVSVQVYDLSDLDQNLIKPRKYEALLFGEALGRNPDLYSFWHSSQRLAPGLNITQYTNTTVDKLIEDIRKETDQETKLALYKKFQAEISKDIPAIFLYSPSYLYILPEKIKGADFPSLVIPSERFSSIKNWYINQEKVWKIFTVKI